MHSGAFSEQSPVSSAAILKKVKSVIGDDRLLIRVYGPFGPSFMHFLN